MVNSKYAPAGGRHPDLQFFFYGYSADCSDGIQNKPEEKGRDLQWVRKQAWQTYISGFKVWWFAHIVVTKRVLIAYLYTAAYHE